MIKLLKYLRGYLRIRVWGFSPERFMNLCSNRGILLWDIVREGDIYYMSISLKGFWELKPLLKKTGTRAAILERYGLPFFLPKLVRRKMFVAGLVLAVAFWTVSSLYIWDIALNGNFQITEDVFGSFLKANQVKIGMLKSALDIEELEKQIRREFTQVTWASAKLSGTKLQIDIKENDAPIIVEREDTLKGTDLVAEYGGRIVSIIVRSGVPKAAIGDTVEQGTVLVEGRVPVYNEDKTVREYYYVDADADIVLEHTMSYSERLPLDYIRKEYTGREKKSYYLKLGGSTYGIPQERPFLVYDSLIRESRPVALEKLSVPAYFGTVLYREYLNTEYFYTEEEAEELLNQKLMVFLADLKEKGVQIIEKDVRIDTEGDFWVIHGEFLVHEPVGVSAETVREENGGTDADE